MGLTVRILGNLEVLVDGAPATLGGSRQRRLLALLVLAAGRPLTAASIAERLWPEELPAAAIKNVQVYVARLRASLGAERARLTTTATGYTLHLGPDELDAYRFESLVRDGRAAWAAGQDTGARRAFEEALALWRGPALGDATEERFALPYVERLEELRRGARDDLLELRVAAGDADVVGDLRVVTRDEPARERPWRLLMASLYAQGRDTEALAAYHEIRRHLRDELGLDPSDELVDLERAILTRSLPRGPVGVLSRPDRGTEAIPETGVPSVKASAPRRRRALAALVAATAFLIGAAAVGQLLPTTDEQASAPGPTLSLPLSARDTEPTTPNPRARPTMPSTPVAGESAPPGAYPTPEEASLLAGLPPALAASCTRGATQDDARLAGWVGRAPTAFAGSPPKPIGWTTIVPPVPVAGLTCRPGSGASRVYLQVHRVEGGTDPVTVAATALSLFRGRWNVTDGRCGEDERAAERWESARATGTLLCLRRHRHDGRPWILWTSGGGQILGFATRDDTDFEALLAWWRATAMFLR